VQLTSTGKASSPLLSPDGSQVAYTIADCDETHTCKYRIVLRDIATGAERPLVENLGLAYLEQWSPDGVRLLYYTWGRGNAGGTYAISRLGGTPTHLGLGAGAFLNGGDTAVVAAQLGASSTVYLRRFALPASQPFDSIPVTKPVNLTTLTGLSISPDGRWMALAWYGSGGAGLLTLHSGSGALSSSAKAPPGFLQLCWSPDSRALLLPAAVQGREGSILKFAVDPATGRFVAGIDTISIASGSGTLSHLALSGDGRSLVYQSDREGETVMWTLARPSSGGPPRPIRQVHSASSSFDGFIPRDGGVVY
jgi:Tol biopolymer transport system component